MNFPMIQVPATKELLLAISRAVDEEPTNVELLSLRAQLMIALMKEAMEVA